MFHQSSESQRFGGQAMPGAAASLPEINTTDDSQQSAFGSASRSCALCISAE